MIIGRHAMWLLAVLLLAAMLVFPFFYYPAEAESLPPEADSAIIPIGGWVIATVLLIAPVVLGGTWLCLRRYQPANILVWRHDRPMASVVATALFFALAITTFWPVATDFLVPVSPLPAYEYYILPVPAVAVAWFATLRIALVSKSRSRP